MVHLPLRRLILPACILATGTAIVPAAHAAPILGSPVTTTTAAKPEGVVLADVNEDGFDDAIVGNRTTQAVQIFRGSASGLGAPTSHSMGANIPAWVTTGDMNDDGHVDVVVSSVVGGLNSKVAVLLGDGKGAFTPAVGSAYATGTSGPASQDALKVADITGDGKADVVTGAEASLVVLPGDGTGALGAPDPTSMMFTEVKGIAIGDFAGDARPDVLTSSGQPSENAELFENVDGELVFDSILLDAGNRVVAGDVDGQGRPDAIFSQIAGNDLQIALSNGSGTPPFSAPTTQETSMFFVAGMALGDLDADGNNDLAVGGKDQVEVMRGNGLGGFTAFDAPIAAVGSPDEVAFGDVDGDAQTDLVFVNTEPAELTLARNVQTVTATGPSGVDFGRGSVLGGTPVDRTLTLTASGPGFYRTSGASVSGSAGVAVLADGCKGKRLRPGSKCEITLRLTPAATGELAGSLIVADNSEAGSRGIPLTGFVNAPKGAPPAPGPLPAPPSILATPISGADTTRPVLSQVSLSRTKFSVAKAATTPKLGTRIRFTLSEPARVTFAFERPTTGLRRGKSCAQPSAKLRKAKAKRCVRYVRDGTIVRSSEPKGARSFAFSGRIGKKALKLGRHRVSVSARDTAGNTSRAAIGKSFRVVRAPKKAR